MSQFKKDWKNCEIIEFRYIISCHNTQNTQNHSDTDNKMLSCRSICSFFPLSVCVALRFGSATFDRPNHAFIYFNISFEPFHATGESDLSLRLKNVPPSALFISPLSWLLIPSYLRLKDPFYLSPLLFLLLSLVLVPLYLTWSFQCHGERHCDSDSWS